MRGAKGCFVCDKDHQDNTRHSRDEVTKAIDKLKAKQPHALLSVEDLATVFNMSSFSSEDEDSSDEAVQWAEGGPKDEEEDFDFT